MSFAKEVRLFRERNCFLVISCSQLWRFSWISSQGCLIKNCKRKYVDFYSEDVKLWQAWKNLLQKWIFNQKELFSKLKPMWQSETILYLRRQKLFYSNLLNLVNATGPTELLLKLRKRDQIHQNFPLWR